MTPHPLELEAALREENDEDDAMQLFMIFIFFKRNYVIFMIFVILT